MWNTPWNIIKRRLRAATTDDAGEPNPDGGAVYVMTAIMIIPILLGSAAISIDTANWYYRAARLQSAADAAALAGSVFMPGDQTSAFAAARAVATQNGYTQSTTVNVVPTTESKPSQLRVTITQILHNPFGYIIGSPSQTITRTAVGEYKGPVMMGSPCNIFGNQPTPGYAPFDSASQDPINCNPNPQFWANMAGPGTTGVPLKAYGDEFATRTCAATDSRCNTSKNPQNLEYNPIGYFYKISVKAPVSSINIQVFDPVMAYVGDSCTVNLKSTFTPDKPNDYSTTAGDAAKRYTSGLGNGFCTGDTDWTSGAGAAASVTTFAVRAPSTSSDPLAAPLETRCTSTPNPQQFKGQAFTTSDIEAKLTKGNAKYNDTLARQFRQWVTLCNIPNPEVGDYYLQVRTNLPYGTASFSALSSRYDGYGVVWAGHNRFALRTVVAPTISAGKVTMAGYGAMSIYANSTGSTASFHLARVTSGSAGRSLEITLWDIGDVGAGTVATLTILPPPDAKSGTTPMVLNNCLAVGDVVGTFSAPTAMGASCSFTGVSATKWNGKIQIIRVPLPVTYNCDDASEYGCWFKIQLNYPGVVNDTTTWSTDLNGQPVRLIE
ncbi:MAG: pilus assembly protein TadG-related protein [Actinomycetes bacterium]